MAAWRVAMTGLLLLSACAQPQPLVKSPVAGPETLGLDRPMTPLAGPVTVASDPWMPFSRFCEIQSHVVQLAGQSIPSNQRTCGAVRTEPVGGPWRRVTLTATEGEFAGAALMADHSAARQVRNRSFKASPTADLSVQEVRMRNQSFESRLHGIAGPRATWVARQGESGALSESISRFEGFRDPKDFTITCRVEGASAVAAREVIVASCDGVNPLRATDPARRIDLTGNATLTYWVAVDVATGAPLRGAASTHLDGTRTEAGMSRPITVTGSWTTTLD